jgi:hypothetical protein
MARISSLAPEPLFIAPTMQELEQPLEALRRSVAEDKRPEPDGLPQSWAKIVTPSGVLSRYRVRILVGRSEQTEGITAQDRVALLRRAYEFAKRNTELH